MPRKTTSSAKKRIVGAQSFTKKKAGKKIKSPIRKKRTTERV